MKKLVWLAIVCLAPLLFTGCASESTSSAPSSNISAWENDAANAFAGFLTGQGNNSNSTNSTSGIDPVDYGEGNEDDGEDDSGADDGTGD